MNVLEGSRGFLSYSEVQALSSPFRLCLCSERSGFPLWISSSREHGAPGKTPWDA